jgi:hypothetical protein
MNPCTHICFKQIHILNDSEAVDMSVAAAASSTLIETATDEAAAADVTVPTVASANLATAEVAATAEVMFPIDIVELSSKGMAFVESVATGVGLETAESKTDEEEEAALDVAEGNFQKKGVSELCCFCMNSYMIRIQTLNESTHFSFK